MYGFGEFKIVANICMGIKNPLPNGINSDFKKPKKNDPFFLVLWIYFVFYTEPYTILMVA